MKPFARALRGLTATLALALLPFAAAAQSGPTEQIERINGVAVAPQPLRTDNAVLLIGTDFGLMRAGPDGMANVLPDIELAVTGLAGDINRAGRIFLSGIDARSKPAPLMLSEDGGASWQPVSASPVAVRSLSVMPGNPDALAAVAGGIVTSRDGGKTWGAIASSPEKVFSVARSSLSENVLYAATMGGLLFSDDGGESWRPAHESDKPATAVTVLPGGKVLAYIFGVGLVGAQEPGLKWQVLEDGFADRYILSLAADPLNPDTIYAIMDTATIMMSRNGGRDWISYEGSDKYTPERLARGEQLFEGTCAACHGAKGVGEAPGNPEARDEFGFKAPALNDDMHGWHHSDAALKATISQGSPRNPRMVAFSEQMSEEDIENIVVYLKSLWSLRSLACQGARHMRCQ
jgi:photosystem II stability/assembly factor-like uncharacterized protein